MFTEPTFQLCWLRESSSGHLDFDAGTTILASRLELAILGLAPGGAGESTAPGELPAVNKLEIHHIWGGLESLARFQSLPKWLNWRLAAFFGSLNTEERIQQARRDLEQVCAMCDRIRQANGGRPWSELYLPYFARRDWNTRFDEFASMQFECRNGAIQVIAGEDPMSLESIVIRSAALVFQPRPEADLPFRFHSGAAGMEQPWAGMLAERWGVNLPLTLPVRSIELTLPGQAMDSWRRSPRLHHGRYHQVWMRVALQMQWLLRRWSLAQQLSSLEGFEDVESVLQLMMYNALRPYAESARPEPCYDVLDEAQMLQYFRKAARRLPSQFEAAAKWLLQRGHTTLAEEYRPEAPAWFAAKVAERCFRGRAVRGMLIAEMGLVNAITRFSQEAKVADTPRAIRSSADNLIRAFDEHLPRIFRQPGVARKVAPAIFLAVSSAMGVAVGGAPAMEVRFETVDGAIHRSDGFGLADSLAA